MDDESDRRERGEKKHKVRNGGGLIVLLDN
jgi:hypothetical protein